MTSQPAAEPTPGAFSFDPEIFWAVHKQKIIVGAVFAALVFLAATIYIGFQTVRNQKAAEAYTASDSVKGWQSVISKFPGSTAAGNAWLRIGTELREKGKYQESDSAYDNFVKQFSKHPLLVNGYMGLAANAEIEKNVDRALEYYRQISSRFGNSYQAPMALFNEARLTEARNLGRDAQRLYETVVERYPQSAIAGFAGKEAERLSNRFSAEQPVGPVSSPSSATVSKPGPTSSAGGAHTPEP
ncbi:MAG: tetratricopeptide repeat protein [Verrucomicrobia bacterium]|nr:tetratricopeptide repeat protein [Verrucomicrobiota bacterium]